MTWRDVIQTGLGNMWRMKLRTLLTLLGVVIAIGAFVSMLSFAAGLHERVEEQYEKLGLLFTIQVYQERESDELKENDIKPLNDSVVTLLSQLPGVELAYPFDAYQTTIQFNDTTLKMSTQALSSEALRTKMFSQITSGNPFESDTAKQAIVTEDFLEELKIKNQDSVLGQNIIVSVMAASFDSGLVYIFKTEDKSVWERLSQIKFDSLRNSDYRNRILTLELGSAAGRFIQGFLNARQPISDTLEIVGVMESVNGRSRTQQIIVPYATGRKFVSAGFTGDMTDLISSLSSGALVNPQSGSLDKTYSRVTLDVRPGLPHGPIRDSIKTMGFRSFSYAEEFEEMTKVFLYIDLALGVIGLIALFVSSLGIVNTMLMSITERRREIGVLKSLGADEGDIKLMFLVESALIGSIGALGGILLGWTISRIASVVIRSYMEKQGVGAIEVFALPLWLIAIAFALGLLVSLVAGYYPSARAARVDPVQALRYD